MICLVPPLWAGMAREEFAYSYDAHTPTQERKHAWLKAALYSSDPRPSVYQLSSGVNWSILNICCGAFHTFLCLVSKLVLTWEICPPPHSVSLSFLHIYMPTQTSYLTGRREHCRTITKETTELLTCCVVLLSITTLSKYVTLCIYV